MSITATIQEDGSAVLNLDGQSKKIAGIDVDTTRERIRELVVEYAAQTGQRQTLQAHEATGAWEVYVFPDGTLAPVVNDIDRIETWVREAPPLRNEHPYATGKELGVADAAQISDGTELKKFHLSFTPALKQALVVEAGLSGITQTDLIREAVLAWISPRIDQRNQQTTSNQ